MDENTPPTFGLLDRFPTEIRDIIFGYMIQSTIESHIRLPDYDVPCVLRNEIHTQGLSVYDAKSHLTNSPWVALNKKYCAEYLQAFVRVVELRARFTTQCANLHLASRRTTTEPHRLTEPKDVLELIAHRFNIAGPYVGIDTSSKTLLSRIKSISLSFHYWGSFFERGFGKTDRRQYPYNDFLAYPLKLLRQYHEDYDIPANKLSIHISYGDPSWTVEACLGYLDRNAPHRVVSLSAVQAQIHVNDRDASIAATDRELEVLREAVEQIIQKMRIRYPKPRHLADIMRLEDMINRDMDLLRRRHLRAIDEATQFWSTSDRE
jgi:hypothetical protein